MKKLFLICCMFIGLTTAGFAQTKAPTDPEQKAKGLQKELKLSEEQTAKVAAIYKESAQKFDKIKTADNSNTNKMLVDVGPLRKATIKKIKGVLTASQAAKYDALLKQSKNSSLNGGWSDGWS
jgi:protein CpxP